MGGGAIGGWAEGVRGHAVNRAGLRFFYSSLTDRCFSRHISTASILNSLPKRERERTASGTSPFSFSGAINGKDLSDGA